MQLYFDKVNTSDKAAQDWFGHHPGARVVSGNILFLVPHITKGCPCCRGGVWGCRGVT